VLLVVVRRAAKGSKGDPPKPAQHFRRSGVMQTRGFRNQVVHRKRPSYDEMLWSRDEVGTRAFPLRVPAAAGW
jgi:hypothetical protein